MISRKGILRRRWHWESFNLLRRCGQYQAVLSRKKKVHYCFARISINWTLWRYWNHFWNLVWYNVTISLMMLGSSRLWMRTLDLAEKTSKLRLRQEVFHVTLKSLPFLSMLLSAWTAPKTLQNGMDVPLSAVKWRCPLVQFDDIFIFFYSLEQRNELVNSVPGLLNWTTALLSPKNGKLFSDKIFYSRKVTQPSSLEKHLHDSVSATHSQTQGRLPNWLRSPPLVAFADGDLLLSQYRSSNEQKCAWIKHQELEGDLKTDVLNA